MPPLYIVQQGAKIRISKRRLQVEIENGGGSPEILLKKPLVHVSQVVLFGNVGLTTPAIGALLDAGIEVVFLTLDGRYRGQLTGSVTPHIPLRRSQYALSGDPLFALEMSKGFVLAKLSHQRALLLRHNRDRRLEEITGCTDQIASILQQIPRKTVMNALRGLEGSAGQAYFRGFRQLFDPQWGFLKRTRRPPADPVNVLLSFGYTLIVQVADAAIRLAGLDPYVGFFHEVVYNRPAAALDLVEEFRPVVDGVVLWCCAGGAITPADFEEGPPERPVILKEDGQRRFIRAFEERLERSFTHPILGQKLSMRRCIIEQARQVAGRIRENQPGYTGMGFR